MRAKFVSYQIVGLCILVLPLFFINSHLCSHDLPLRVSHSQTQRLSLLSCLGQKLQDHMRITSKNCQEFGALLIIYGKFCLCHFEANCEGICTQMDTCRITWPMIHKKIKKHIPMMVFLSPRYQYDLLLCLTVYHSFIMDINTLRSNAFRLPEFVRSWELWMAVIFFS